MEESTASHEILEIQAGKVGANPDISIKDNKAILEAQEKINELHLELERSNTELKKCTAENAQLKEELFLLWEKFEKAVNNYKDVEADNVKLKEDLHAQEAREIELLNIDKAFKSVNVELEESKKKIGELERELDFSLTEARKFEKLHVRSASHAEREAQWSLELEKLLHSEKVHAEELEGEVHSIKEKLEFSDQKVAENDTLYGDLRIKNAELEETKKKMNEEMNLRQLAEAGLRNYEAQFSQVADELMQVRGEKELLEAKVGNTKAELLQLGEFGCKMEENLKVSEENFHRIDALFSEAKLSKEGLEKQLETLQRLHHESSSMAEISTRKKIELEKSINLSNAATEEARSQLREVTIRYIDVEQRNVSLEQKLSEVKLKCDNSEEQLGELSARLLKLDATLKVSEEEKQLLTDQLHRYEEKVSQTEAQLGQILARNSELEQELMNARAVFARANELDGLLQTSHTNMEEFAKKASENICKIQELEELVGRKEAELKNKTEESHFLSNKISEVRVEIEELQDKTVSLERELRLAKERCSTMSNDKVSLQEKCNELSSKLEDEENRAEVLQNELKITRGELENASSSVKIAHVREDEVSQRLRNAEEQLEQQGRLVEEINTRNVELESLNAESSIKLEETISNLKARNSEADSLHAEIESLQEQVMFSEQKITEGVGNYELLTQKFDQSFQNVHSLERLNEELQREISSAEDRASCYLSEKDALQATNVDLQSKILNLQTDIRGLQVEVENLEHELQMAYEEGRRLSGQLDVILNDKIVLTEESNEFKKKLEQTMVNLNAQYSEAESLRKEVKVLQEQVESSEQKIADEAGKYASLAQELDHIIEKMHSSERSNKELRNEISGAEEIAARSRSENEMLLAANVGLQNKISELHTAAEGLQSKAGSLEHELQAAYGKERHFIKQLDAMSNDKIAFEEESINLKSKIKDAENQLEVLQSELKVTLEKLGTAENSMKIAEVQASEVKEKLRSSEEQLKHQERLLEQVNARNLELETLSGELRKKLEETTLNLYARTSEAETLREEINVFEEQIKSSEQKIAEGANGYASLNKEFGHMVQKVQYLERLKQELSVTEGRAAQSLSENEILLATNADLRNKISKLHRDIEELLAKTESLEHGLQVSYETERCFTEKLGVISNDKIALEEESNELKNKIIVVENQLEILQNEVNAILEKLQNAENNMKMAEAREGEVVERLQSAQIVVEQISVRNLELEGLTDESQKNLEETQLSLKAQTSENQSLREEIKALGEQFKSSRQEILEGTRRYTSLSQELANMFQKVDSLERLNKKLQNEISGAEEQAAQSSSDKEILFATNVELQMKVSELRQELELHQAKAESLEHHLHVAHDEKKHFTEQLDLMMNDKIALQEESNHFNNKLKTTENQLGAMQNELEILQGKLESAESSMKLVEAREDEVRERLRAAMEQLEQQERWAEQTNARNVELVALSAESLVKLEETISNLSSRNSEAVSLREDVKTLHEQIKCSEQKIAEGAGRCASLTQELSHNLEKVHALERLNEQLHKEVSDGEDKTAHSLLENDILLAKNMEFQTRVSDLQKEIELFQANAENSEHQLQVAYDKEIHFIEQLDMLSNEKMAYKEELNQFNNNLNDAEDQLEVMQNELRDAQEKLKDAESGISVAESKGRGVIEKLQTAEVKLEQKERLVEQINARNFDLESLISDPRAKLEEAILNLNTRNSEAESLHEEINVLHEQVESHEQKIAEEAAKYASLTQELDHSLQKVHFLERLNKELQNEVSDTENRSARSASELVATNVELQNKLSHMQQSLKSLTSEKEAISRELASHANIISELTAEHTRTSELQAQTEMELQDAVEGLTQKNTEVLELKEKVYMTENQRRFFEEQAHENSRISESHRIELRETLVRLDDMDGVVKNVRADSEKFESESSRMAEANLSLTQKLSALESEAEGLRSKLSEALLEYAINDEQLRSSRASMEDLANRLTFESEELKNQIISAIEENKVLKQMRGETRVELQIIKAQLDGQNKEHKQIEDSLKDEIERLKNEVVVKSALEVRVKELENVMVTEEAQRSQKAEKIKASATAREAELSSKLEDQANVVAEKDVLHEQVVRLQKELDLARSVNAKQEAYARDYVLETEAKTKQISLLEEQVRKLMKKSNAGDEKAKEKLRRSMLCWYPHGGIE